MSPVNYKLYPADWKTRIRPDILNRAGHCCEKCGVKNYAIGYRDQAGKFYDSQLIIDALEDNGYDYFDNELSNCYDKKGNPTPPVKIVLTIAHIDHDVSNNDYSNLAAYCQSCHLSHDKQQHAETRRNNRLKMSLQGGLFETEKQ